jgi:hypothetical protein
LITYLAEEQEKAMQVENENNSTENIEENTTIEENN